MVPQAAVIQSPRGTIVYVVDASGKAVARPIEVVYASGEDAAVKGVQPGERVVLEGRQNLRPGSLVVERAPTDAAGAARRGRPASGAAAASAASSSPGGSGNLGAAVAMGTASGPTP